MKRPIEGFDDLDYFPEDDLKIKCIVAWDMIAKGMDKKKVLNFCRLTEEQLDDSEAPDLTEYDKIWVDKIDGSKLTWEDF